MCRLHIAPYFTVLPCRDANYAISGTINKDLGFQSHLVNIDNARFWQVDAE